MFEMIPFRKNNNGLRRRDDFFNSFIDNFFDNDFMMPMNFMGSNFKVDLKETEDSYLVEADLPGIPKEAIDIDYNNGYLTITAKRDDTVEDKKENYVRRERHYGEFKRSFYVDNVDESKIDASFKDGVLKVTLPKQEKGQNPKRKIDIH
jgi:HSP20 family protein